MKEYKNRTIALILASVVTVAGAFGAENYKNSLMSLNFDNTSGGAVNITLHTKTAYSNTINPIKKDAYTYVIMLPETKSEAKVPELSGNIQSVDIKTMPYTTSGKGYTKITVKTTSDTVLSAKKAIYIPSKDKTEEPPELMPPKETEYNFTPPRKEARNNQPTQAQREYPTTPDQREYPTTPVQKAKTEVPSEVQRKDFAEKPQENTFKNSVSTAPTNENIKTDTTSSDNNYSSDYLFLICGILVVILLVIFLYIKSKRKIAEMVGEQTDLDFSDDTPKEKKEDKRRKNIKNTINNLDKMYSKPVRMPVKTFKEEETSEKKEDFSADDNIVDLDELFQQQTKGDSAQESDENEENDALEAFLSGFSFDETMVQEAAEKNLEEIQARKDLYDECINNQNVNFSSDDVEKINSLMNTEVSDDAVSNLKQNITTDPIKPTKKQILEDFMTTLKIKQDVTFSREDVEALRQLISVELDQDFITDLRTNPERANSMRKEIEERNISASKKVNEILTLNVKDMLPDLSEALKKQGNRKIESNAKADVVYYSEGYEYTKLSIKDALPDLSTELNSKNNTYRPSDTVELAVAGYDTPVLHIDTALPDLNDVKANPKKYEDTPVKPAKANEKDLLKNISNVTFKPFYDGSEEFEVLNKPEDFENVDTDSLREEFNQFGNFEIVNEENITSADDSGYEEFDDLLSNNYYDLDKNNTTELEIKNEEIELKEESEIKLDIVENNQNDTVLKTSNEENVQNDTDTASKTSKETPMISANVCVIDGETFNIVNSQHFTDNMGCYLAKNDNGYSILGFAGNKIFKIKHYKKLDSEKIQSRVSEKLPDGSTRYLVRIGIHKFILNVSKENMEYIMDLC